MFSSRDALDLALSQLSHGDNPSVHLSTGVNYTLSLKKHDRRRYELKKLGSTLILLQPVEEQFHLPTFRELLLSFLMRDQMALIQERLHQLASGWIEERCRRVRLRMVMSRWGSCEKRSSTIMLSAKLLFLESKMLDYVCIHELAHLKYADHSNLYWDLVTQKMPDWKIQRKKLRQFEKVGN